MNTLGATVAAMTALVVYGLWRITRLDDGGRGEDAARILRTGSAGSEATRSRPASQRGTFNAFTAPLKLGVPSCLPRALARASAALVRSETAGELRVHQRCPKWRPIADARPPLG